MRINIHKIVDKTSVTGTHSKGVETLDDTPVYCIVKHLCKTFYDNDSCSHAMFRMKEMQTDLLPKLHRGIKKHSN